MNWMETWMSNLDDRLRNIPVIYLAIPGSHDSMSSGISPSSPVAPDSSQLVKKLSSLCCYFNRFVYRWCITQDLIITSQLNKGIRYFDLRVATKPSDTEFYFVHGLYGSKINGPLEEVNSFLNKNTCEVVILDFQHFYNFTPDDHNRLITFISSLFKDKLCPLPWDISVVTLNWMRDNKYSVIVIYRNSACESNNRLWPGFRWPTPWPETTSISVMLKFLTKTLEHRRRNTGLVTQCVITPDVKFVIKNPCGNLAKECALPCHNAIIPWLSDQKPGPNGINVVISDYININNAEFCKTVIALNLKLNK